MRLRRGKLVDVIEIRGVFDASDWPEDARKAAESIRVQAALDAHADGRASSRRFPE
jgi:hypothetical protein